jgi:hypothetical protein
MGSTFVSFRDRGFEASDSALEIWLRLLVDEIDKLPNVPSWLRETREEWKLQATAGFGFGVMPGLDEIVISSERRDVVLELCASAMRRLHDYGPIISRDELNDIAGANEESMFTRDAETEFFERTGDYFTKLLRGELKSEECDARFGVPEREV